MSSNDIRRLLMQVNRRDVCRLLTITDEQYCELQFEAGMQYLAYYEAESWRDNRAFWNWWINQHDKADEAFIIFCHTASPVTVIDLTLYREWHEPQFYKAFPSLNLLITTV